MSAFTITKNNFETEVMNASVPVLIDFWAGWCGPCKMIAPIVDSLGQELQGKIKVGKVNVDEQPELAARFGVMSIPTLVAVKNGTVAGTLVGVRPKADILNMLGVS